MVNKTSRSDSNRALFLLLFYKLSTKLIDIFIDNKEKRRCLTMVTWCLPQAILHRDLGFTGLLSKVPEFGPWDSRAILQMLYISSCSKKWTHYEDLPLVREGFSISFKFIEIMVAAELLKVLFVLITNRKAEPFPFEVPIHEYVFISKLFQNLPGS
ncbi:hypothetical protein CEXT_584771 [Caerostris extrusa]|uniref:Uncharacterized protein n=1 Tax=Caerostris extrusa TaxID=172846 RepID=A0AAV4T5S9_CAEEX|nr:hypothetical protein CEXT_584771 [Caerostris extrusa]